MKKYEWKAQVFGDIEGKSWEISVVRVDNLHGQKSWGWFDETKLLVSHNGGPCHWPLAPGLGLVMKKIAEGYANLLNKGVTLEEIATKIQGQQFNVNDAYD